MPTISAKIVKTPGTCGGDARIEGTRIPVWVLVNYRRQVASDAELLHAYPSIKSTDLELAWEYAACHPEEIDRAIADNEADDAGIAE